MANDCSQDVHKVYLIALPVIIAPKVSTDSAIQKIMYKGLASNMEFEDQTLLMERCRTQKWFGVAKPCSANWDEGSLPPGRLIRAKSSSTNTARSSLRSPWRRYRRSKESRGRNAWKSKDPDEESSTPLLTPVPFTQRPGAWDAWQIIPLWTPT